MRALRVMLAAVAALLLAAPSFAAGGPFGSFNPGTDRRLANGGRPAQETPFPAIKDLATLHIVLERSMCYGTCPDYSVDIAGDGTVVYTGNRYVAISGRHVTHIAAEKVTALVEAFRQAKFFWLFDDYASHMTDLPTYRLSIAFDGTTKSVSDYAGLAIGMPKDVRALELMVDDVADTKAWIEADEHSFDRLKAEGWDFYAKDDANRGLLSAAASSGNTAFVRQLLAAGVPADGPFGCGALAYAARGGNAEMADVLLAAGAPAYAEHAADESSQTCDALTEAASRGIPAIVESILKFHPDSARRRINGTTALIVLAQDAPRNAILPGQDFSRCAQLLIDAGAQVDARDDQNESALMTARLNAGVVRVLLKAGAREIEARDYGGDTPLMRSLDADVTKTLLEAGADPYLKDREGQTALDIAVEHHDDAIAATLRAWMAAHPK